MSSFIGLTGDRPQAVAGAMLTCQALKGDRRAIAQLVNWHTQQGNRETAQVWRKVYQHDATAMLALAGELAALGDPNLLGYAAYWFAQACLPDRTTAEPVDPAFQTVRRVSHLAPVIPFYAVVDVSVSMVGGKLDAANRILPEVAKALTLNPTVNDRVRFGLIEFSDTAATVVPLCDMSAIAGPLPILTVRAGTNYAELFRFLRAQIETDVARLRTDGHRVHRPAVFFLSDGQPGDEDWETAFAELTGYDRATGVGFEAHPIMVPFSVADAAKSFMPQLVHPRDTSRCYMLADRVDPAQATRAMAEILVQSALSSGISGVLTLPGTEEVDGLLTAEGVQGCIEFGDGFLN